MEPCMKRFPLLLLLALFAPLILRAGEKANTILIHPGEAIYARFAQSGVKLKLIKASKEKDDQAQVIISIRPLDPTKKFTFYEMKVENKFLLDLDYEAQIRNLTEDHRAPLEVMPVVAEKLSLTSLPPRIEEVALFGWKLEK